MTKYVFRGFDNPRIKDKEVYYGEGRFTVGKEYVAINPEYSDDPELAQAQFEDEDGWLMFEELAFFDEVVE